MTCRHELSKEQWDQLIASIEAGKQHRAEMMPTDADAIQVMFKAYDRLANSAGAMRPTRQKARRLR